MPVAHVSRDLLVQMGPSLIASHSHVKRTNVASAPLQGDISAPGIAAQPADHLRSGVSSPCQVAAISPRNNDDPRRPEYILLCDGKGNMPPTRTKIASGGVSRLTDTAHPLSNIRRSRLLTFRELDKKLKREVERRSQSNESFCLSK
jgi:hypothetical protein